MLSKGDGPMTTQGGFFMSLVVAGMLLPAIVDAQVLTGTLIGTVKDESAGVLPNTSVRLSSPALITGPVVTRTNEKGQFRFVSLAAGEYTLEVERAEFTDYREERILIEVQGTFERTIILKVAGLAESVSVQAGSAVNAGRSGLASRFSQEALTSIPVRRFSMFDLIR